MTILNSFVNLNDSALALVVKKKDSLGEMKYYCVVKQNVFVGWNYGGTRTDNHYYPLDNTKTTQTIKTKSDAFAKGKTFSAFLLDYKPNYAVEFESLLTRDDMINKNVFEGEDLYGVSFTDVYPVNEIKVPALRKGIISSISPVYIDQEKTQYYADINFKTFQSGTFMYVKRNGKDSICGVGKKVYSIRGFSRDLSYSDYCSVLFMDEAIQLIKEIEQKNTKYNVDEDEYKFDPNNY